MAKVRQTKARQTKTTRTVIRNHRRKKAKRRK